MPFQPLWYLCNVMVRVLELYLISIWCFELTLGYHRRTRPGKYFHKSNFCLNGDMTNMEQNKRRGKRKKAKASLFANEILLFPIIPKASCEWNITVSNYSQSKLIPVCSAPNIFAASGTKNKTRKTERGEKEKLLRTADQYRKKNILCDMHKLISYYLLRTNNHKLAYFAPWPTRLTGL